MTRLHHLTSRLVLLLSTVSCASACLGGEAPCYSNCGSYHGGGGSYHSDHHDSYEPAPHDDDHYAFASYKKLGKTAPAPPPPSPPTEVMGVLPHVKSLQQPFPTLGEYPSPTRSPNPVHSFSSDNKSSGIIRDEPVPQASRNATDDVTNGERFGRRIAGGNEDKATLPPPYITYYNQQCSGEILGSSRGETVASASEKCARLNCQAANARATGDGKYDIVFLRTVHLRSNKKGIYCVSSVKIPLKAANSRAIRTKSSTDHPAFNSFKVSKNVEEIEDETLNEAIDKFNGRMRDEAQTTTVHPFVEAFFDGNNDKDTDAKKKASSSKVDYDDVESSSDKASPTLPPSYYYKPGLRLI